MFLSTHKPSACSHKPSFSPSPRSHHRHSSFVNLASSILSSSPKETPTRKSKRHSTGQKSDSTQITPSPYSYTVKNDGTPFDTPPPYTLMPTPSPPQSSSELQLQRSRPKHFRRPSQPWTAPPNLKTPNEPTVKSPVMSASQRDELSPYFPFSSPSVPLDGHSRQSRPLDSKAEEPKRRSGAWEKIGERRALERARRGL